MVAMVFILVDLASIGLSAKYVSDARDSMKVTNDDAAAPLELIDRAISFRPTAAAAYLDRGLIEERRNNLESAETALAKSASLEPNDYYTWVRLGVVRLNLGKREAAAQAFAKSVALAERYSAPNWFHGLMLRETGRESESWTYISRAYHTDSSFLPPALDLAWLDSRGDVAKMDEMLGLSRDSERMVFGWFLFEKGAVFDARSYLCQTGQFAPERRAALVEALARKGQFRLAAVAESASCADTSTTWNREGVLINGGFEEDLAFKSGLFGWRIEPKNAKIAISIDPVNRTEGKRSLRIDMREGDPKGQLVSQLVSVSPGKRYSVGFDFSIDGLVAGIEPVFSIFRTPIGGKSLVEAGPLRSESGVWKRVELEFIAPEDSEAISLGLGFGRCGFRTCPVIGTIWIDGFNLKRLD